MTFFLFFLIIISFLGVSYQKFRAYMPRFFVEGHLERFSYNSLLKIFLFFLVVPFIFPVFLSLWQMVYDLPLIENSTFIIIFLFAQTFFSLGLGIYMTSILIEKFVFQEIKNVQSYMQLRIAIKFFHGPISHVLIYAGINLYLISLCFFDIFKTRNNYEVLLFAFFGLILGLIIGYAQKINLTWKYQVYAFHIYLILIVLLMILELISFYNQFGIFVLFMLIGSNVYLIYKNSLVKFKGQENLYSEKNWRI